MTTYNASTVSDTAIASGKPVTLQQGRALRDNPLAQAEGSTDAPYIQAAWHPYDGVTIGDGNVGLFYNYATNGLQSSIETQTYADGYEYRHRLNLVGHNYGSTQKISVSLYGQTSGTWIGPIYVSDIGNSSEAWGGMVEIEAPRQGGQRYYALRSHTAPISGSAGLMLYQLVDMGSVQKISKMRFQWSIGGSFDAGNMNTDRRLVYYA